MKISISNAPYLGFNITQMNVFPKKIGIEVFSEFGNRYYWDEVLPNLLEARSGPFSIHGPHLGFDLAAQDCNFEKIKDNYKEGFELCQKYGSSSCVCHTHKTIRINKYQNSKDAEKRALERVSSLSAIALPYGVRILVENLPQPSGLFTHQDFTKAVIEHNEFDALIDVGHALVAGWDIPNLLCELGPRIKAFHIHDNDGIHDLHNVPGKGIMDWEAFFKAVSEHCKETTLILEYLVVTDEEIMASINFLNTYAETKGIFLEF